jgi:transcriptional regulator with XRE-family HTH domain
MDVLERITELRKMRNWTEYRLSEESGLPQSTINTWYKKRINPTIVPLEKICSAFGITLSQFFVEDIGSAVSLTQEQSEMLKQWSALNNEKKQAVYNMIKALNSNN